MVLRRNFIKMLGLASVGITVGCLGLSEGGYLDKASTDLNSRVAGAFNSSTFGYKFFYNNVPIVTAGDGDVGPVPLIAVGQYVDEGSITDSVVWSLVSGLVTRIEILNAAMFLDHQDNAFSNQKWYMPDDLKINIPANVGVIDFVNKLKNNASSSYDEHYDTAIMHGKTFYKLCNRIGLGSTISHKRALFDAELALGMGIQIYNGKYWTRGDDGKPRYVNMVPVGSIMLLNHKDLNSSTFRFIQHPITHASGIPEGLCGKIGPVSYITKDPSGTIAWASILGGPNKLRSTATAVLTLV